jgi:hypothetical protein
MTKISALTPLGDDLAIGDQFIIRDISDGSTPNKSVTVSGITRGLDRGALGAPAIAFASDKNTGLYSPGEDTLALVTAGANRLHITSAGLLGLGTSSPGQSLDTTGSIRLSSGGSRVIDFLQNVGAAAYTGPGFYSSSSIGFGISAGGTYRFIGGGDGNTEIMRLTDAGLLGIGTTSPTSLLHVAAALPEIQIVGSTNAYLSIKGASGGPWTWRSNSTSFSLEDNGSEKLRIDSSGRLLVGTSTARTGFFDGVVDPLLQVEGSTTSTSSISVTRNSNDSDGPRFNFGRSRGTGNTVVQSNDRIGAITYQGNDGAKFVRAAEIECFVDGTPGTNDMPGRLVFSTTADGAASPTERMRISSAGHILIGQTTGDFNTVGNSLFSNGTAQFVSSSVPTLNLNRKTDDGVVLQFYRDTNTPGSISVTTSATTYATSSDYRLKENVAEVTDGITRLLQLKPSRFNFIADPDRTVDGFIAHEAQAIVPECVTGTKDEVDDEGNPVMQGIDQSKLVPLLTAALQEAIGRIETLEAEVAALKGA